MKKTNILTIEQKEACKNICIDFLNAIENYPNFLERENVMNLGFFFTYNQETKHQPMHWKSPFSPRAKKLKINYNSFLRYL